MGLRRGLFFGLLAGSGVAALLSKSKRAEAPAAVPSEAAPPEVVPSESVTSGLKDTLDKVRHHAEEAIEAAHEAQAEKEAELRRELDAARHKP